MRARETGGLRTRVLRGAVALVLTSVSFAAAVPAAASVIGVACDGQDDIAAVQDAVNAAQPGDTIAISGTCDFSAAPPHGGTVTSISAAAVVIRPTPIDGLTIESAGAPQSATIVGSGVQTAFAVVPGATNVTIRGLRFVDLARPVVVLGTDRTTVGAEGGLPAPAGNRIVGGPTTNSAVLAAATDQPMMIAYGAAGAFTHTIAPGAAVSLTNLTVRGNSITYSPPGPAGAFGISDVVGIDVRQAGTGVVEGVTIAQNAVGLFTGDFASFRYNGVRVEGLAAVPASNPPQVADYRIRNVTISGNNLGRFEELGGASVPGVDPAETHAAGRVGVVLIRVGQFSVTGNEVRARVSTTGPSNEPGGGVVVDGGFGVVSGNQVLVPFPDPATPETADLGAVAVVGGVPALFGDGAADQATTAVEVTGNVIGDGPPKSVRRGLVVSGADRVTAWGNDVRQSTADALFVGADVRGPTGMPLERTVSRSVLCNNVLDGLTDAPAEVTVTPATPPSRGNAFPGGMGDNFGCRPTVSVKPVDPDPVDPGETLEVSGRSWAARPVSVRLDDQDSATAAVVKAATADDLARYLVTFSSIELASLGDGRLTITVTADPGGLAERSVTGAARLNLVANPPPAGTVSIDAGGDAYANHEEVGVQLVKGLWVKPSSGSVEAAVVWWSKGDGTIPSPFCGPVTVAPTGSFTFTTKCSSKMPDGPVLFSARWRAADGELSTPVSASMTKDTVPPTPPTILAPEQGATINASTVTVSGTGEPGAAISVVKKPPDGSSPWPVVATAVADGFGSWSVTLALADGSHSISAFQTDAANNRSGPVDPPVDFRVDTSVAPGGDTVPPPAPVLNDPGPAPRPATFSVSGTVGEPGVAVAVFRDTATGEVFVGSGKANSAGAWSVTVRMPSGTSTIVARAFDAAGNRSDRSNVATVNVDATPPTITIATPNDTLFVPADTVTITGTAGDAPLPFTSGVVRVVVFYTPLGQQQPVVVDLNACTTCPGNSVSWQSQPSLPPGIYRARAVAVDTVGNTAAAEIRFVKVP